MKTKTLIAVCLLAIPTSYLTAQQSVTSRQRSIVTTQGDSIIILRGKNDMRITVYEEQSDNGGKKNVKIYEGVYLETVDADKRTFLDALPFIPKKKRNNAYDPHNSGLYIGFSRISDNFFSFNNNRQANLNIAKSWEFGFNFLSTYHNFKKNPHWGLNFGANWGYRSFNIDGNRALLKADDNSLMVEGDEETSYNKSRLRHFFFRIPVTLEWQQRVAGHKLFFINAGPEFEIRHGVRSFSHINGGKKQTMGKGMYVRPVDVNLLVQAGYGDLGLFLRYSSGGLFQKDKGMEVSPYSFGIAWYW